MNKTDRALTRGLLLSRSSCHALFSCGYVYRAGMIMVSETFQALIERANFYAQYEGARALHERRTAHPDVEETVHAPS